MHTNFQKSCCLRVACPRCDVIYAVISSSNGRLLGPMMDKWNAVPWCDFFYKFNDRKMLARCSQARILHSGKQHLW